MVVIITGSSHTGKTFLAQKLLEKYYYPYVSIDHLKMGLIRSGQTKLTPYENGELTKYLWPIVAEMIKTAIENNQNLIVEGCYVPFDYNKSFSDEYLAHIKYVCLIFSEDYIQNNYSDIMNYASVIEKRENDEYPKELMIEDNAYALLKCIEHSCNYILISDKYNIDFEI